MDAEKARQIYDDLYSDVDGKQASLNGRHQMHLDGRSFVYGEVVFDGFAELLKDADNVPGGIFCDCGSGTGKAVMMAHLLCDFKRCVGIEIIDNLYSTSKNILERYKKEFWPGIQAEIGEKEVILYHGSILHGNYCDVDLLFMNSTCFQEDLMSAIELNLSYMKPGSQVVTLSRCLRSPNFVMEKQKTYDFSWGKATGFFHRKLK